MKHIHMNIWTFSKDVTFVEEEVKKCRDTISAVKGVALCTSSIMSYDKKVLDSYQNNLWTGNGTGVNFDWLRSNIANKKDDIMYDESHIINVVHVSPGLAQQMHLVHPNGGPLGGEYNIRNTDVIECLVVADMGAQSTWYADVSEFRRVLLHELAHAFSHWTGRDVLEVHTYDTPQQGKLFALYEVFDFTKHSLLTQLLNALSQLKKKPYATFEDACRAYLGKDASPSNRAPSLLACAETVSFLVNLVIPFNGSISTVALDRILASDSRFVRVFGEMKENDILLYVTGTSKFGGNTPVSHGHAHILVRENGELVCYSNNSLTGLLDNKTTPTQAKAYYEDKGGYAPHVYRRK